MLFTACLQDVIRTLDREKVGVKFNAQYLGNLTFAYDVASLSNWGDELQRRIAAVHKQSRNMVLKIIMQRTKVMLNILGRAQLY